MLKTEIDSVDANCWNQVLMEFDDASIYQTVSMGLTGKAGKLSHIIIKGNEGIIGCCQVRIRPMPFWDLGVADVVWGPLCAKKGSAFKPDVLAHLVYAIKEEYAMKRGYLLRISPHAKGETKQILREILEREGFKRNASERPYRTFILDLSPSLEDLRKNLLQKWRNCLNRAERNNLRVVEGASDNLYDIFLTLAKEMVERKDLTKAHSDAFQHYRRVQQDLPEAFKMKIMVCEAEGEPVCATICSAIGDTGIYMLGATGEKGLKVNGSYLLQWRMIQWMKEKGVRNYDLGAFNPELNPGVYHFKQGIAGKKAWDETFLGEYHGWFNLSGRIAKLIVDLNGLKQELSRKLNSH